MTDDDQSIRLRAGTSVKRCILTKGTSSFVLTTTVRQETLSKIATYESLDAIG